jgi:hypothetical protein
MQDIRRQGQDVSEIDWDTAYQNVNKEAAAYAEQMVSRNQIPNDPTKNPAFIQRGDINSPKDVAFEVFKDVALPFTSFARNTQARLFNDIRKFNGGDRMEAAKSISATVAEAAVFNTIKAALGIYVYQQAQNYLLKQYGYEKQKDKKIEAKSIAANSVDDLVLAGMGSIVDNSIKSGINYAYQSAEADRRREIFKVYDPSTFGETNWGYAGVYGVLPEKNPCCGPGY